MKNLIIMSLCLAVAIVNTDGITRAKIAIKYNGKVYLVESPKSEFAKSKLGEK